MALLLHLIEKREVDITRIALAAVTDEFLQYIEGMERADPSGIADFLVVAARLVQLKSALLLPTERVEPGEEDAGETLARALESYRQFKQVAGELGEREAQGLRSYPRAAAPPPLERRLAPEGVALGDLFAALRRVLQEKAPESEPVDEVVRPLRVTVRQRIREVVAQLREGEPVEFLALLSREPSRQEVIATFLAMLEVLRRGWAQVRQEELWGRIELVPLLEALPEDEADEATREVDEYV